ncbi:MAG: hypothetical protein QOJ12_2167 [Thermoleophilales bacterium]|nr:hypothetical protein [Thermoleophilales bacterium]
MSEEDRDWRLMQQAVATEADGHRALLAGDDAGRDLMRRASSLYRESWEAAGPRAFGRLIGMQKAAVIAGDASAEAEYARREVGAEGDSPPSWYALAIAALVEGDDGLARRAAEGMREGPDAFGRAADAIDAIAHGDVEAYATGVAAIVSDFEQRAEHLTGVPIADTALMLERIAAARGMAARPPSELLPAG